MHHSTSLMLSMHFSQHYAEQCRYYLLQYQCIFEAINLSEHYAKQCHSYPLQYQYDGAYAFQEAGCTHSNYHSAMDQGYAFKPALCRIVQFLFIIEPVRWRLCSPGVLCSMYSSNILIYHRVLVRWRLSILDNTLQRSVTSIHCRTEIQSDED